MLNAPFFRNARAAHMHVRLPRGQTLSEQERGTQEVRAYLSEASQDETRRERMNVKKLYKGLKKSALDEDPWATRTKDATSGEKWGPTGTQLNELARATTYGPEVFNEIFNVLYFRLDERKEKWRKCFKALIVLEFFLLRGDKHCVNPIRIGR